MRRLIVGMGRSGQAVARHLDKDSGFYDTYDENMTSVSLLQALGHHTFRHFSKVEDVPRRSYDQVVVSPGVPSDHPLLVKLARSGSEILGEVEFAYRKCKGRIVAVTGSNGKSTTVSLIHHILERNGLPSKLCGNIGVPFTACLDPDPATIYVLEVSSFQLEQIHSFAPEVGMLLNIAPDHLDRHGNFEAYRDAKLSLFRYQSTDQWAVFPKDFPVFPPGQGRRIQIPGDFAQWQDEILSIGSNFRLLRSHLNLLGGHNDMNALYACLAAVYFGLSAKQVTQAMKDFRGLPHRLERLGECKGRLWINDSKATNVHATQAAVAAMRQPYVLILGGCDKGERFSELELDQNPPKAIVAYGETGPVICEDLAWAKPHLVPSFEEACIQAHQLAGAGDAVLLAPACASFDQFKSFTHRGEAFRHLFQQLGAA